MHVHGCLSRSCLTEAHQAATTSSALLPPDHAPPFTSSLRVPHSPQPSTALGPTYMDSSACTSYRSKSRSIKHPVGVSCPSPQFPPPHEPARSVVHVDPSGDEADKTDGAGQGMPANPLRGTSKNDRGPLCRARPTFPYQKYSFRARQKVVQVQTTETSCSGEASHLDINRSLHAQYSIFGLQKPLSPCRPSPLAGAAG